MINLASLRDLCERATPGEWHVECGPHTEGEWRVSTSSGSVVVEAGGYPTGHPDAAFIAAARSALPAAIAEIERLRGLVASWEALGDRHELALRDLDCKCYQEIGDSPCPVHPNPDEVGK